MSAAPAARAKTERIRAVLEHREPDRVPIGEFFWSNFLRRAQRELRLDGPLDPYRHWDLDFVVLNPNMDPHLTGIRVLEQSDVRRVVQTGFGATIELRAACPMRSSRPTSEASDSTSRKSRSPVNSPSSASRAAPALAMASALRS